MTKIDIISGFLGAGKTTLIKKLLQESFKGEKVVLIENEFGEIGIDGGFLKDAGVEITEMNSGCICCSLVGDFGAALRKVLAQYAPDRIIIEPSGVGKLSDVIAAVERVQNEVPDQMHLSSFVTVVDATKARIYMKNFGEFFNNQVEHASAILLSRTQGMDPAKLEAVVKLLRQHNEKAAILTTPWDQLSGAQILEAMAGGHSLAHQLMAEIAREHGIEHDDDHCCCGHDHHHDHDHDEHEHHHDHDEHEHEHHHEHGDDCGCDACTSLNLHHDHDHDHEHHHHHADEVFTSWGRETARKYSREELQDILADLSMTDRSGVILRAKGRVPCADRDVWLHFDLVPGEFEIREGAADYTGRLCVIGSGLKEDGLEKLFLLA